MFSMKLPLYCCMDNSCSWFLSHFCCPWRQKGAFLIIGRRCLTKATEERVYVGSQFRRQSIMVGSHGGRSVKPLLMLDPQAGSREWTLAFSLLSLYSPAHGMEPPTFRVPSHLNPIQKLPYRHAQKSVSLVSLDPVKLTVAQPSQRASKFFFFFWGLNWLKIFFYIF